MKWWNEMSKLQAFVCVCVCVGGGGREKIIFIDSILNFFLTKTYMYKISYIHYTVRVPCFARICLRISRTEFACGIYISAPASHG